ncbi:hypothetical protein BOTBODRAFT_178385 [Botryobasidium botryosum FD-172 SS1]|uniref:Retrotransposon Copia-like N-terminal domain-containing protein n=1 Tax=Botryobasidium botryosum (strain FD-172 SS1) TaxID=930990 RepID=A0A067ME72_BOTB1|nr:hypothetical protein BOTBODRAFT_178385 [Botryobasidium botryosum FD-172 SS1]
MTYRLKVPVISDKLDLSGSNWMQWKGPMLASARAMRIMGYLDGSIPKPSTSTITITLTPPASSTTSPKPAKSHPSSLTPTLTEWEDCDAIVFAMIWQNVKTLISLGIHDLDTAAQVWQKLLAHMQQKSDLAYYLMRQELGNLQYCYANT